MAFLSERVMAVKAQVTMDGVAPDWEEVNMDDHRKRSIVKSLTWRAIASLTTMIIVYAFTERIALSLGVGVVEVFSKMALYYAHERLWTRIRWGRAWSGDTDGYGMIQSVN